LSTLVEIAQYKEECDNDGYAMITINTKLKRTKLNKTWQDYGIQKSKECDENISYLHTRSEQ
jgi:hypothetical protein